MSDYSISIDAIREIVVLMTADNDDEKTLEEMEQNILDRMFWTIMNSIPVDEYLLGMNELSEFDKMQDRIKIAKEKSVDRYLHEPTLNIFGVI